MQETSRYAVGIDIGTTTVRCVVAHIDAGAGSPTIVGVGQVPNHGMRKGTVVNLTGPAEAIDKALGEAERMSGYEVNEATISVNGSHILSTKTDGMIAVGTADHEINLDDIIRVEEVATVGKVPANRSIIEVVPHSFRLDGQDNIKDPVGMTGTRLEIVANVVSALTPMLTNLEKASQSATVQPRAVVPAGMAAAKAVLTEQQLENGVAVVDLGGATTSVAVYEEGDLQYFGVIPIGGMNITNDLAICLKTDPEIAEKVKIAHAFAGVRTDKEGISLKHGKDILSFDSSEIDDIVEARLEEIFDAVNKELKKAGRAGQLPSGVVLTGGTAKLKGIADFAKNHLGLAARVGKPTGFGGIAEQIDEPQFAAAVGLMLVDAGGVSLKSGGARHSRGAMKSAGDSARGLLGRILKGFKQ
ncbi:MAG: cell division protein FtsA [Candidatus Saccharimonadaceae bacterium]